MMTCSSPQCTVHSTHQKDSLRVDSKHKKAGAYESWHASAIASTNQVYNLEQDQKAIYFFNINVFSFVYLPIAPMKKANC